MDIAKISLQAGKDVAAGEEATLETLFPWQDYDEVKKVFEISNDINRGMPLSVHIRKFGPVEVAADIDKKVGQRPFAGLWLLLSFTDLRKRIQCLENVKKDEWLDVTITDNGKNEN